MARSRCALLILCLSIPMDAIRISHFAKSKSDPRVLQKAHDLFYATHPFDKMGGHVYSVEDAQKVSSDDSRLLEATAKAFEVANGDWMQFDYINCAMDLDLKVDVVLEDETGWKPLVEWFKKNPTGIPIVKFGQCQTPGLTWHEFSPERFGEWKDVKAEIGDATRQFSAISAGNENWGLLSLWHPNRTATWRQNFDDGEVKHVLKFLNDPMVKAWAHLQHIDIKHPKLIMLPLARFSKDVTPDDVINAEKQDLAGFYSSRAMSRAMILQKLKQTFGDELKSEQTSIGKYTGALSRAKFSFKPPGMGMDCYGIWESLQMAAIPVVERGYGNEGLMGQLPILLVDDYEKVTPELLRAIEPYFKLHADDFNWNLLRKSYWLEGLHGKEGFLEKFVDGTSKAAPHASKDSHVAPEHCVSQVPMTCPMLEDDDAPMCCGNPRVTPSGKSFIQVLKNQYKPWAFGFVPRKFASLIEVL